MGKIRVRTLGDEDKEKKDSKKAERKAEAKKAAEAAKKAAGEIVSEEPKEVKVSETKQEKKAEDPEQSRRTKKEKFAKKSRSASGGKRSSRSKSYLAVAEKVDKSKLYKLSEALTLLPELKISKFDETVELHINTTEQGISGAVTLPHGSGKSVKVEVIDATADPKHVEEVIKKVEAGKIDFDVLVATPDSMPKLAKIARFLGPKGLMPNPKNGTVTAKPEEVAKKFAAGQMNFKTEAKSPIIHLIVGKVSFGDKKLSDNIKTIVAAINAKKIKNATLKSTMSPGLKIDLSSI